jgi:hypothetical protein
MGKRRALIIGAFAAAAALVIAAGVGLAQSDEDTTGGGLLDRVAEKLGIEPDTLEDAVVDARNEQIDEAVERGDLTPEQAERLRERAEQMPPLLDPTLKGERHKDGRGGQGWSPYPHPGAGGLGLGLDDGLDALADFLGISNEQLMEELGQPDATLASVAEAHGRSREELKDFIESKAGEFIDRAVEDGWLAEVGAERLRERLGEMIDRVIDLPLPGFSFDGEFRFEGEFPFRHRERGAPDSEPQTESSFRS